MVTSLRQEEVSKLTQKLNFDKYRLAPAELTLAELDLLLSLPEVLTKVKVKTNPNCSKSSAFSRMSEDAILVGFIKDKDIKCLVMWHERPKAPDDVYDFSFVAPASISKKPAEDLDV